MSQIRRAPMCLHLHVHAYMWAYWAPVPNYLYLIQHIAYMICSVDKFITYWVQKVLGSREDSGDGRRVGDGVWFCGEWIFLCCLTHQPSSHMAFMWMPAVWCIRACKSWLRLTPRLTCTPSNHSWGLTVKNFPCYLRLQYYSSANLTDKIANCWIRPLPCMISRHALSHMQHAYIVTQRLWLWPKAIYIWTTL